MTSHAQIMAAEAAAVAGTSWTRRQVKRYRREAVRQGYTSPMDQITTMYLARFAPRGKRGPKARDPVLAAIRRHSPASSRSELARLRARIACAGRDTPFPSAQPRDPAAFAQACLLGEARRRYPGNTRWSRERRRRWREALASGQGELI